MNQYFDSSEIQSLRDQIEREIFDSLAAEFRALLHNKSSFVFPLYFRHNFFFFCSRRSFPYRLETLHLTHLLYI
jgi:hypothetical protein